jgi:peroxiredoxin
MTDVGKRAAYLNGQQIGLLGVVPGAGDELVEQFTVPAARRATEPLTANDLRQGLVLVSTLPNIHRHACVVQIVHLHEHGQHILPQARIVHVSADPPEYWDEVTQFHGNVTAPGFSLTPATPDSRDAFVRSFGIGVAGQRRIAHGLFALKEGVFLGSEVPTDQMSPPGVDAFLARIRRLLEACSTQPAQRLSH